MLHCCTYVACMHQDYIVCLNWRCKTFIRICTIRPTIWPMHMHTQSNRILQINTHLQQTILTLSMSFFYLLKNNTIRFFANFVRLMTKDAIKTLPLANVPDVIGLNRCAEIAYNKQYIDNIWHRLSQCSTYLGGLYVFFWLRNCLFSYVKCSIFSACGIRWH